MDIRIENKVIVEKLEKFKKENGIKTNSKALERLLTLFDENVLELKIKEKISIKKALLGI
jgi:hypothetical protein